MTQSDLEAILLEKMGGSTDAESRIGRFLLYQTPTLAQCIADEWAKKTGELRFGEFLKKFEGGPETKPTKPSSDEIDDIIRRNPPDNQEHTPYFRQAFEKEAFTQYFNNLRAYEAKTKEKEHFQSIYQPDVQSYIRLLCEKNPELSRFFFEEYRMLPVSESDRERHTYIVGGSGSGKTELAKWFVYHYLNRNTAPALVIIDPHGDLARQVAKWPELADGKRLAYIAPGIGREYTPVFNPFDIPDEERTEQSVSILVDDTIEIIQELLEKDFTTNMETLMRACLTILFYRPGSTFADVLRFVDKSDNRDLLEMGERVFPAHSPLLRFIRHDLLSEALGPTRNAVKMRFTSILSRHFFYSFLVGKSTFQLERLIRDRAVIIFNLSKSDIGTRESRIFGKFVLAHLRAFAFKQGRDETPEHKRVPVHVFVDECQEFITESIEVILAEARKYRVYLTLIQQSIGKGMSRELTDTVLTNTAVKATGKNSEANRKAFAAETGATMEDLERLEKGTGLFCIRSGARLPVVVKVPGHRLRDKRAVPKEVWEQVFADQIKRFYARRDRGAHQYETLEQVMADEAIASALNNARPAKAPLKAPEHGPDSPIDY